VQSSHQLHRKCRQQRQMNRAEQRGHRLGLDSPNAQQTIRQHIGRVHGVEIADNFAGQTTQIFDQHHLQCHGHRPQLGNQQGLHTLIGAHELGEHQRVEAAIGMGDKFPGKRQHAGLMGERAIPHTR